MINLPITVRNTIRKVLSENITSLQKEYISAKNNTYYYYNKHISSNCCNIYDKSRFSIYRTITREFRKKLYLLHNINWYIKYPFTDTDIHILVDSELQVILHYLRLEVSPLYSNLAWLNKEIYYQKGLTINDGTLKNKIEFLQLNILQNDRRKLLRKIYRLEEAIKLVKLALKGKSSTKKPLTIKRKIRKLWHSLTFQGK